jgi:hypothetical protein
MEKTVNEKGFEPLASSFASTPSDLTSPELDLDIARVGG